MATNQPVYVLYKIVNSDCDRNCKHYNAFPMNLSSNGGRGPTLAYVKQYVYTNNTDDGCVACVGILRYISVSRFVVVTQSYHILISFFFPGMVIRDWCRCLFCFLFCIINNYLFLNF